MKPQNELYEVQRTRDHAWMPYVIAGLLAIVAVVVFCGCVTPQDTQNLAASHQALAEKLQAIEADKAAGAATPEQVAAATKQALEDFKSETKAIGQDVESRSRNWLETLGGAISDPSSLITLLGLFGLNTYRNRTRKTDPAVSNAMKPGTPQNPATFTPQPHNGI